jgi:O-antigen/teichoic acid export membrane protein
MGCQWAMLVVVARLGSPETVGQFALGVALSAPVILFTNLGLRRLQVADAAGRFRFADYFGLRLITNAVALGAVAALALSSGYSRTTAGVILAMGLAKAVEATSDAVHGVLQKAERMDLVAGALVLRGIAGIAGIAGGLVATRRLSVGLLAMAAGWTAVLVLYDLPRAARLLEAGGLWPRWRAKALGRLAWRALPLGLVTTLGSLLSTVPCVMIEKYRGAAELGIYTALAYAYSASHRIMTAMSEAASARLARHHAAGRRAAFLGVLSRLLVLAGAGGLAGVAIAALLGRPVLTFVYGPVYGARADLLVDLMIAATAAGLGVVLDYAMTAMGRLRIQPFLAGAALILLAWLSARFLPTMELRGAVLALGSVAVLQGLASFVVVAHSVASFPHGSAASAPVGKSPEKPWAERGGA